MTRFHRSRSSSSTSAYEPKFSDEDSDGDPPTASGKLGDDTPDFSPTNPSEPTRQTGKLDNDIHGLAPTGPADLDDTAKLLYPSASEDEGEDDSTAGMDESAASFLHQPVEDLVILHALNTHLSSVRLPTLHNILDCTPLLLITLYETLPPALTTAGTYKRHRRVPYVARQGEGADVPIRMQNMKLLIGTIVNDEALGLDEKMWRRLVGLDLAGFCEKRVESVRKVVKGLLDVVERIIAESYGGGCIEDRSEVGETDGVEDHVSKDMSSILWGMVRPSFRPTNHEDTTASSYGLDKPAKPPSARTAIPESGRGQGKRTKPRYELTSTKKEEEISARTTRLHVSQRRTSPGSGNGEAKYAGSSSDDGSFKGLQRRYLALKPAEYFSPRRKEGSSPTIARQASAPRHTPNLQYAPSTQPAPTSRQPSTPAPEPKHRSIFDNEGEGAPSRSVPPTSSHSGQESPDTLQTKKSRDEGRWWADKWLEEQATLTKGAEPTEDMPLEDMPLCDDETAEVRENKEAEEKADEDRDDMDTEVLEGRVRELLLNYGYRIRP